MPDIIDRRIYRINTVERNQIYLLHTKSGAYIGWHSACMGYENFLAYHFCYIQPSKWVSNNGCDSLDTIGL